MRLHSAPSCYTTMAPASATWQSLLPQQATPSCASAFWNAIFLPLYLENYYSFKDAVIPHLLCEELPAKAPKPINSSLLICSTNIHWESPMLHGPQGNRLVRSSCPQGAHGLGEDQRVKRPVDQGVTCYGGERLWENRESRGKFPGRGTPEHLQSAWHTAVRQEVGSLTPACSLGASACSLSRKTDTWCLYFQEKPATYHPSYLPQYFCVPRAWHMVGS